MWIPINKTIPPLTVSILVTIEHQHRWTSLAWLGSDSKTWHYTDNCERIPKELEIIAWQPLPEPYNGIE